MTPDTAQLTPVTQALPKRETTEPAVQNKQMDKKEEVICVSVSMYPNLYEVSEPQLLRVDGLVNLNFGILSFLLLK